MLNLYHRTRSARRFRALRAPASDGAPARFCRVRGYNAAYAVDFFEELKAVLAALKERGIDYALCGGVALAIHGAPRATQDIDLLVRPEDLGPLSEVARACGFTLEALPMDFANGITVKRFTKLIDRQPFMLDALLVSPPIEKVWAGRIKVAFDGGTISVVSREGLIALKLAAARPQDIADIKRLDEANRG